MQQWEIDFERISTNLDDTAVRLKLKAWGDVGWEPYEIVGVTHYFKRPVRIADAPKEVYAARLKMGEGSGHLPIIEDKNKKKK